VLRPLAVGARFFWTSIPLLERLQQSVPQTLFHRTRPLLLQQVHGLSNQTVGIPFRPKFIVFFLGHIRRERICQCLGRLIRPEQIKRHIQKFIVQGGLRQQIAGVLKQKGLDGKVDSCAHGKTLFAGTADYHSLTAHLYSPDFFFQNNRAGRT